MKENWFNYATNFGCVNGVIIEFVSYEEYLEYISE